LTYKLINNLKFKVMKYDVRIVIYGTNEDTQIETKMLLIPRVGDISLLCY